MKPTQVQPPALHTDSEQLLVSPPNFYQSAVWQTTPVQAADPLQGTLRLKIKL